MQFNQFYHRTEANSSTSDYAIPLPPPPGLNDFTDVGADPIGDSGTGIEHGPFLPPGTPALNNLFSEGGDSQDDSPMGELRCYISNRFNCINYGASNISCFYSFQ